MIIDTHCHVDLYQNPLAIAKECERLKITTICMTNLPSHFEAGYPHLRGFTWVKLALGFHPLMVEQYNRELPAFKKSLHKTNFIGEIGLDFSREGKATKDLQIKCLRFVLQAISDRPRFVSLHSRAAESTVLELLEEFNVRRAVFHWYSGSLANLDRAIKQGHYFSINPAMTQSKRSLAIIARIPKEHLLTETDGPFLEYQGRPARPGDVRMVLKQLSTIWHLLPDEVELQIISNYNSLINALGVNTSSGTKQ